MKKTILLIAAIFSFAIIFTACKDTKKEEVKEDVKIESHEVHNHETEATADVYQCPMGCEHGKTYDEAGACPVCKMDLKVKSVDKNEMKHADNCKCKEAGECTCEGGVCKCQSEMVSMTKECKMCEPGKCKCKA